MDYQLAHQAPRDDGYSAPLSAALTRFGPDVLDHPDFYGASDDETLRQMRAAVSDPETQVRIYRAVPPEHLEINSGDWVTLSREYAHNHGYVDGADDWPVVFADIPARYVWTDGNDPSEYGYDGPSLTELQPYTEDEPMPPPEGPLREAGTLEHESAGFTPSAGAGAERRIPPSLSASPSRARRPTPPR